MPSVAYVLLAFSDLLYGTLNTHTVCSKIRCQFLTHMNVSVVVQRAPKNLYLHKTVCFITSPRLEPLVVVHRTLHCILYIFSAFLFPSFLPISSPFHSTQFRLGQNVATVFFRHYYLFSCSIDTPTHN